jgi:papain like cysteine protease AvrRpt2
MQELESQMLDTSSGAAARPIRHCYNIYDVPLIPQDMNMACWYASFLMLFQWYQKQFRYWEDRKRATYRSELVKVNDPSEVPADIRMHLANDGLPPSMFVRFALTLGLKPIPRMTPTPHAIRSMLQAYGPIMTVGSGHAVVIRGIGEVGSENVLGINDPWPPNVGTPTWKNFQWLTSFVAGYPVESNFLHLPFNAVFLERRSLK